MRPRSALAGGIGVLGLQHAVQPAVDAAELVARVGRQTPLRAMTSLYQ